MTRRMPVAEVEREFGKIVDAAELGEPAVVLRNGKPVAIVSPVAEDGETPMSAAPAPLGLLGLAGALADWETMEEDMAQVIAERQFTVDRPGPDFSSPEFDPE